MPPKADLFRLLQTQCSRGSGNRVGVSPRAQILRPAAARGWVGERLILFAWPQNILDSYQAMQEACVDVTWLLRNVRYRADGSPVGFPWTWTGTGRPGGQWMWVQGFRTASIPPPQIEAPPEEDHAELA